MKSLKSSRVGWRLLAAGIVTVIVAAVIVSILKGDVVVSLLTELGGRGLLVGSGLYSVTLLMRVLRLRVAFGIGSVPTIGQMLPAAIYHQFFNHLIPARLGELALPYFLWKKAGVELDRSLSVLIVIRFFDSVILLFIGASALLVLSMMQIGGQLNLYPILIGAVCILAGLFLVWHLFVHVFRFGSGKDKRDADASRLRRVLDRIRELLAGVQEEVRDNWSLGKQSAVFGCSILVWFALVVFFHFFLRFSGIEVAAWQTFVGSSFANLTQLLPINTFGSFGSLEAGWVVGFHLVGFSMDEGLATGVIMHALVILLLAAYASVAWLCEWSARIFGLGSGHIPRNSDWSEFKKDRLG